MGYLLATAIYTAWKDTGRSAPESAGQRLDRELREQRNDNERKIRELEQEVERLKRWQTLGL